MALSKKTKEIMVVALADKKAGTELAAAVDSLHAVAAAAHVANITSSNLVGVDGTGSNAAPLAGTETRLDALEAKVNAILAALQAASLMS